MRPLVFLGICVMVVNVLFENNLIVSSSLPAGRRRIKRIRFRPIQLKRQIEAPIDLDKLFPGHPLADHQQSGSPLSRPRSSESGGSEEITSTPVSNDEMTSVPVSLNTASTPFPIEPLISTESEASLSTIPEELATTTESCSTIVSNTEAATIAPSKKRLSISPSAIVSSSFVKEAVTTDITSVTEGNEFVTDQPKLNQNIFQIEQSAVEVVTEFPVIDEPTTSEDNSEVVTLLNFEQVRPEKELASLVTNFPITGFRVANDEVSTFTSSSEEPDEQTTITTLPPPKETNLLGFEFDAETSTLPFTESLEIQEIVSTTLPNITLMTLEDDPHLRTNSTEVEDSEITWRDIQNPFLLGFDYLNDEDMTDVDMVDDDMDFYMDILAAEIDGGDLDMSYEDDYIMLDGSLDPLDLESRSLTTFILLCIVHVHVHQMSL